MSERGESRPAGPINSFSEDLFKHNNYYRGDSVVFVDEPERGEWRVYNFSSLDNGISIPRETVMQVEDARGNFRTVSIAEVKAGKVKNVSRETPPLTPEQMSQMIFEAQGFTAKIGDIAALQGTVRAFNSGINSETIRAEYRLNEFGFWPLGSDNPVVHFSAVKRGSWKDILILPIDSARDYFPQLFTQTKPKD